MSSKSPSRATPAKAGSNAKADVPRGKNMSFANVSTILGGYAVGAIGVMSFTWMLAACFRGTSVEQAVVSWSANMQVYQWALALVLAFPIVCAFVYLLIITMMQFGSDTHALGRVFHMEHLFKQLARIVGTGLLLYTAILPHTVVGSNDQLSFQIAFLCISTLLCTPSAGSDHMTARANELHAL